MKVLLLDADGVILHKNELFSERFAHEHNVPLDSVVEFFKGPFGDCQAGMKDLKEELAPFLERWGWKEGVDSFLTYWFESDFHPNVPGLALIQQLRQKGVACYMASNNEKYRAHYIQERLEAEQVLDGYFFSAHLQAKKSNSDFFVKVMNILTVEAKSCCFVDNDQGNVNTAAGLGLEAHLYREGIFEELLSKI